MILLMEELLHQLICRLFHYLQGLHIPGGCLGFLNHQQYQHNFKNAPTSCSTCDRHWMPYQSDWVFACHFFTHNTWKRTTPWTRKGKSRTSWVTSKYVVWLKTSNHVYINVSHITKYNDMYIYEVLTNVHGTSHDWHILYLPRSRLVPVTPEMGCRDANGQSNIPIPSMGMAYLPTFGCF